MKVHSQGILYEFDRGTKAKLAHQNLCQSFGADVLFRCQVERWYKKFRSGHRSLENAPRSGRPHLVNSKLLRKEVETNSKMSERTLASTVGCSQSSISRTLKSLGKVQKLGAKVPHRLTDFDRQRRVTACTSLLHHHRTTDWIKSILTSDEKYVLYDNVTRRAQWVDKHEQPKPDPKGDLFPKKALACVWWDSQGIVY